MSPELLPRVFELFTQGDTRSSQPGLGIGLALARRLVELHGGRLDGRSEGAGRGSEFVIQMPLATTAWVAGTETPAEARLLERRVLVIDDNEDAANAMAMLIEDMGGSTRVAYDGENALTMIDGTNLRSSSLTSACEGWTDTRPVNGFVVCWAAKSCLWR